MYPPFSVLMSVYHHDTPVHFRQAVESVTVRQTLPPSEVVLVVDGPLRPELETTVLDLARKIPVIKVVRIGKETYERRGGWRYFISEKKLQDYMLRRKITAWPRYLFNISARFAIQVALPHKIRGVFFRKLFRE